MKSPGKNSSQKGTGKGLLRYSWLILLVLGLVLYGSSFQNKYALDDEFVVENPVVKKGISALPEIWTSFYSSKGDYGYGYRPLVRTTFALEYTLFGQAPGLSHFINFIIYFLTGLLIFRFSKKYLVPGKDWPALLLAAVFLSHPVHTEAVLSLKNREEILGFLLGLWALTAFLEAQNDRTPWKWLMGFFLLVMAFFTKETTFAFIFIIPVSLYFFTNVKWTKLSGIFVLLVIIGGLIMKLPDWLLPEAQGKVEFWQNPLFGEHAYYTQLATGMGVLMKYLQLLVFPFPLLFYYGYNSFPVTGFSDPWVIMSIVIHAFAVFVAIRGLKKKKPVSWAILFYLASVLMFSNLLFPVTGIIGERLIYMASFGFCFLLSLGLIEFERRQKMWGRVFIVALLIFWSAKTINRNGDWENTGTFYSADLPFLHNSVKANDLYAGYLLLQATDRNGPFSIDSVRLAKKYYLRALEIYPAYANAWNNLGGICQMYFNQHDSALHAFAMAASIDLSDPKPLYNSGLIYQSLKDSVKAEEFFRKTLEVDSVYIPALTSLADQLFMQLKFSDAIPLYIRIERLAPGRFAVYNNLGSSYVMIGDTLNALKYFEQALAMNSSNKALCGVISDYYQRHGNKEKADYYGKLAKKN